MDGYYNERVTLTGVLAEMLPSIGKISLCVRIRTRTYDRSDEVQLEVLLDGYKPNTRGFLGMSHVILSYSCPRAVILTMTGGDIIAHAQVNITKHSMKIEERVGLEGCKKVAAMVEAAHAFVLAALLIN
jgi:hypothetical protein